MKGEMLTIVQLLRYSWRNGFRRVALLVASMVCIGLLIGMAAGHPFLAPFIYSLF